MTTPRLAPASQGVLPPGLTGIEQETHAVVAAAAEYARAQFVELQFTIEPRLVARVDAAQYRGCLQALLQEAIDRAQSGVLVTATRQADKVEIAILDDGTAGPAGRGGAMTGAATVGTPLPFIPDGASLSVEQRADRGTTMLLRLPLPDHPAASPAASTDGARLG